jgi:trk system potassium uptake protein TrkH
MIFFTLQCACAGSTSGGIKADRIAIFWKSLLRHIRKIQHPKAVIAVRMGNETIGDDLIQGVLLYITLYLAVVFSASLILTLLGVDILTAFSGSAAAMGNVGPGFGQVGSISNFSYIPNPGLWVLSAVMLLGRLEIFGLVIFIFLRSWR